MSNGSWSPAVPDFWVRIFERLVEAGEDVICVDNFFTSQKTNVTHLLGKPNFELLRHDVIHPLWLEWDQIYNLACPTARGITSSIPSRRWRHQ